MELQPTLKPTPTQLKRIRAFADLTDDQLAVFLHLIEVVTVKPNQFIVKQNDPGDCMYLLLDGDVSVTHIDKGRETMLASLETGDFFGEVCLFDQCPRSAHVIAKRACTLLRISRASLDSLSTKHPDVAAPFLMALLRTVVTRIRQVDRRFTDSMLLARQWNPTIGRR